MTDIPVLDGITAKTIETTRLSTRVLFSGDEGGIPVIFVHGNVSNATFWEETMLALPSGYRGIAPDNRGYGGADPEKLIDAKRGMGDFSDDLAALMDTLDIEKAHVVGHSLGGSILWRFMMDYPDRILTVTQAAPGSPYGFGGSKGTDGKMVFADGAGAGGGAANPDFARRLSENDASDEQGSPRFVMNTFYWKPPFKPEREEALLQAMWSIHTHEKGYPGDFVSSENWPSTAPGSYGPNNALAASNTGAVEPLYRIDPKPSVLWIRGADDQIVANQSMFDIATLGKLGVVPGYPGEDVMPPQPMIDQTRAVMEQYAAAGGSFEEVVFEECGHTPYIEKPDAFNELLHRHIGAS
ncbi:MAG: alpha/beta hydrolase [Chloroflexota bacterium]